MRKVKYYKCPECQKKFKTLGGWANHVDMMHPESRPKGFSDSRFFYYTLTGKTEGKCIECHSPTDWNEATGKYNRFCNNPNCKKAYVKLAKSRMVSKYGKEYLLNDPEMQKKMLLSKKISGYYTFSNGSGKLGYVGSYEKDFLQMMDQFMGYSAPDIMSPSPHTYFYEYQGKQHFYIPDFYIPNLNLEIEIKTQDNKHPKIQAVDKVKEKLKDDVMTNNPKINYIKINDKDYKVFFEYLLNLKDSIDESALTSNGKNITEINDALESAFNYVDDEKDVMDVLLEANEGVFVEPYEEMSNLNYRTIVYFIFFTTKSGVTQIGNTIGDDHFGNILVGAENVFADIPDHKNYLCNLIYAINPQFDGDDIARTNSVTITEYLFPHNNDTMDEKTPILDPNDTENEYMMFALTLPKSRGWERTVNALIRLSRVDKLPLVYGWDKPDFEWVNDQNKYHYFCYSFVVSLLRYMDEIFPGYSDDAPTDPYNISRVELIDRGFMAELSQERILRSLQEFSDNFLTDCVEYSVTRSRIKNYNVLDESMESLFYENSFSDLPPRFPDAEIVEEEPAMESIQLHTNFDKVKIKGSLDLSKFRKILLTQQILDKYKEKCASFAHCRISNMSKGFVWVDKSDNIVGFVNVVRKPDNIKWIQALNLQPNYQGYGLYEQLLKVAVRELGGTDIETPPKNDSAREVYDKFGFKVYTDEESRRCMSIRADAARTKYGNKAKTNATNMTESGLFPVYVILTTSNNLTGDYANLLTNEKYAHVSIAFNADMNQVYSFGTKDGHDMLPIHLKEKNLMYKLKTDPEANYAIYTKLVSKNDFNTINNKVKSMYAKQSGFRYDVPSAVKQKMDSDKVNEKQYFCSGFVSYLLGAKNDATSVPDIKNVYLVDMGMVKDYSKNFIQKKTESVYKKHYMEKEKDSEKQPIEENEEE